MKGSYIKKISILLTIIFLSSYVIASSFVQHDTKEFKKNKLINSLSNTSGHLGIAGGQYLDLNFEKKRVSKKKIIDMQLNKT